MYEVLLAPHAERDLLRLEVQLYARMIRRIRTLAKDPRPPGCRKLEGSEGDYRIRVGDYRVLYAVDDRQQEVRILRVLHRSKAYR